MKLIVSDVSCYWRQRQIWRGWCNGLGRHHGGRKTYLVFINGNLDAHGYVNQFVRPVLAYVSDIRRNGPSVLLKTLSARIRQEYSKEHLRDELGR